MYSLNGILLTFVTLLSSLFYITGESEEEKIIKILQQQNAQLRAELNITRDSLQNKETEVYIIREDDLIYMAATVNCESGLEPIKGQIAVAEVIMNRYYDKNYRYKSIKDVVTMKGQFDGVRTKRFTYKPHKEHYIAALTAMIGSRVVPENTYYFANECASTDTPWIASIQDKKIIDLYNHTFYER